MHAGNMLEHTPGEEGREPLVCDFLENRLAIPGAVQREPRICKNRFAGKSRSLKIDGSLVKTYRFLFYDPYAARMRTVRRSGKDIPR